MRINKRKIYKLINLLLLLIEFSSSRDKQFKKKNKQNWSKIR